MDEDVKCILLMWSGGVSSTAILLSLLSEPKFKRSDIVVHHMHLTDYRQRAAAESTACKRILDYIEHKKKYRKFFFSESIYDYSFMQPPGYTRGINDSDICAFVAANICGGKSSVRYLMFGGTEADKDQNENYTVVLERSQSIVKSVLSRLANIGELIVDYPRLEVEIPDVFLELPRDVKKMVFSCQFPAYSDEGVASACNECEKCAQRKIK